MANVINATSTGNGGLVSTGDDSGILNIQTNETTAITVDASQNVGIGTATPVAKLDVSSSSAGVTAGDLVVDTTNKVVYVGRQSSTSGDNAKLVVRNRVGDALTITGDTSPDGTGLYRPTTSTLGFTTAGTERMRIDSSGNLLVGLTSYTGAPGRITLTYGGGMYGVRIISGNAAGSNAMQFSNNSSGEVGTIYITGTTTTYNTSSDYRLKNTIIPMTNALDKVARLKPVTYKWNYDNSDGEGFIAHELAEVCPHAVTGEKDAIDENGDMKPQGIDTSFLVATLTAALQETKALLDTQAETINALTARIVALEGQ